jgi:methylsterol monooxygenase
MYKIFLVYLFIVYSLFHICCQVFRTYNSFLSFTIITYIVPICLYWILGGLYFVMDYTRKPEVLYEFKIQKKNKLNHAKIYSLIHRILYNQVVVTIPTSLLMIYPISSYRLSFNHELPSFKLTVFHLGMFTLIEEALFYYIHKLLHKGIFYKHIHKIHHEWTAPIGLCAIYAHPIEHIVSNLLPLFVGPFIFKSHVVTVWLWLCMAVINTIHMHSGYHLPFLPSSEQHDFHHKAFNVNYGVFHLLDTIHNTNRLFKQSLRYSFDTICTSFQSELAHSLRAH